MARKSFMPSRRNFLANCAEAIALGYVKNVSALSTTRIVAGAIRWDAWYQRTGPSTAAQELLGPQKFHERAPLHCVEKSTAEISCTGSQAIMDAEILAARRSGLEFWAFDWYPAGSSLRVAWNLYQNSALKGAMNWCGLIGLSTLGSVPFTDGRWRAHITEWATYMLQSNYQKISIDGSEGRRPILFIQWYPSDLTNYFAGDLSNLKTALRYLDELLLDGGLEKSYVVILRGVAAATILDIIGADALGSYLARFSPGSMSPYRALDQQVRAYWYRLAASGKPIVPTAMFGWDTRPRLEHPVPWDPPKSSRRNLTEYYTLPTPFELAAHIQAAVDFIKSNPIECPSRVLLIYSWDECDEGGGLLPTLGDPSGKFLSAIAPILSQ